MTETTTYDGKAQRVTLFEDRAEVVRVAEVEAWRGVGWVGVTGVGPFIDDRSLQARITSTTQEVRVLSVRVVRRTISVGDNLAQVEEEERLKTETKRKLLDVKNAMGRVEVHRRNLNALAKAWLEALSKVPPITQDAEPWGEAWSKLERSAKEDARQNVERQHQLEDADEALGLAESRLAEARKENPRYEAVVEVQLEANSDQKINLELTYRTPCALWRPEHLARLKTLEDGSHRVEIMTWATAWQVSGEDWSDIEVHFSTARPASAASAPTLVDDVIRSRTKSEQERKKVVVESREQTIQTAGGASTRTQEMPGVDDGGEPVNFSPEARVTLLSNGEPLRIEVTRIELDATLSCVLFPERSDVAHLKADLTLEGEGPLLAGPLRVARGTSLVGRSRMNFVAPGEAFEIGFGADDGIRSRRQQTQKRDRVPVVGTQKIAREVKLYLSNISGEPRTLMVIERVPVSELESVEIRLGDTDGWILEKEDGFLKRTVQFEPRGTLQLGFKYEIKAASEVVLPF